MRVIVAGGRDFIDWEHTCLVLDHITTPLSNLEIVSGGARGADAQGERYAEDVGCHIRIFPADWDKHGKRAGILRNEEMALYGHILVAFWDGKSPGTKHMIQAALKACLQIHVYHYVPLDKGG